MDGLKHTMAAMPAGTTRRVFGTAYWDGTEWFANIDGNLLTCYWLDPIQPVQGGNIVVDVTSEGRGLFNALVIGGYTSQPRPGTGTVQTIVPAGVATQIVFLGDDGATYTTDRFIGSYATGDMVYLDWAAGQPTIIGKIPILTVTPPAPPPLPAGGGGDVSGVQRSAASASDTWWGPGGWGTYATSQRGGEDVYSGSYFSGATSGAWFYGPQNTVLAGRTIRQMRFRLPERINAGNYNSAAVIHLYAHNAQSRPGGDVTRIAGPLDVTVPARYKPADHRFHPEQGPGWIILPESFHPHIVAGGGISIAGEPYVGFQGRIDDPDSGKIETDWNS